MFDLLRTDLRYQKKTWIFPNFHRSMSLLKKTSNFCSPCELTITVTSIAYNQKLIRLIMRHFHENPQKLPVSMLNLCPNVSEKILQWKLWWIVQKILSVVFFVSKLSNLVNFVKKCKIINCSWKSKFFLKNISIFSVSLRSLTLFLLSVGYVFFRLYAVSWLMILVPKLKG